MHITLLTYGSRGDVQPFVALARGLQRAGHVPLLAAPHRFADFAAEQGVPFAPLPGDPEVISAELNQAGGNVIQTVRRMMSYVSSIAPQVAAEAFAACDGTDLIVHSFLFTTGGHSLARARGLPDVSIQTFPVFAPTRAFPNVAAAWIPPGPFSYLSHWLATQVYWQGSQRMAPRQGIDLQQYWPFGKTNPTRTPLIFAYSPAVLPRPADWTAPYIHIPGYFFLDTPDDYQPPAELAAFLAAGDPPVCVTFGSMVNRAAGRIRAVVREALARTGQRAIVLTGWGGAAETDPGPDVLTLEAAPHDWLLRHCVAVVHHGGAGTTAAGLRAGIPNIVVPHAADQPFWGQRVATIGAGPTPIALKRLAVETLSAALRQTAEPALRAQAARIGQAIQAEDGVGAAVRLIEARAAG